MIQPAKPGLWETSEKNIWLFRQIGSKLNNKRDQGGTHRFFKKIEKKQNYGIIKLF